MKTITQLILTGIAFLYFLAPRPTIAITSTSEVSVSVPSSSFYGPNLISPPDNHATNSARTSYIWKRPSPLPSGSTLHHYDLFIDDVIFANNIPDSLTSQDFYFYTASASSGTFYLSLKQDQSQGYHTWKVAVYDDIGRNTATSNWTYYIDSVAPFISLTKINTTSYSWDTTVLGSIPEEAQRYINVTNSGPKLSGKVETNANFQFSLICPSGAPTSCTNQSWINNSTDGNWEQQLTNLTANINYSVILSATDATNNTTIFPTFYLTYTTSSITPTLTATPTITPSATNTVTPSPTLPPLTTTPSQTPLPSTSATLTPPPELAAQLTPTPFIAKTPPAPTPPPKKQAAVVMENVNMYIILFVFLCLGLPLHLALWCFSTGISFRNIPSFLYILAFPFLTRKNSATRPFSTVHIYDPDSLNKTGLTRLSDINGKLYIPKQIYNKSFVKVTKVAFSWKDQIINKNQLLTSCLNPIPKKYPNEKEKIQIYIQKNLTVIPLILAIITSGICLVYYRNPYTITYFYLSIQYLFSEHLYPKITK